MEQLVQVDWSILTNIGIGGVSLAALYCIYRLATLFIDQWRLSTDALNRNTESFKQLAQVFETHATLELNFQREVLRIIRDSHDLVYDTSKKVTRLYDKMLLEEKENTL
jgi:hypothetical protein